MKGIILFPPEASTQAHSVDALYLALVWISAGIVLLVFGLIVFFSFRYRAGSTATRKRLPKIFAHDLEVGWTVATLLAFVGIFTWAAATRLVAFTPPHNALNIRVVAKQWMWKFEHPNGAREINTLHLPEGVPVRLSMTSQDVIHSFFVPAFREKQDVLPDRITTLWFTPSKVGQYALRCAEFCGTNHALMTGNVFVMSPEDYAAWADRHIDRKLPKVGAQAFIDLGCAACHTGKTPSGPLLAGVYGTTVDLSDGKAVIANEEYIEKSILDPRADIVKGYQPVMPAYRGVITTKETSAIIAYLKSLNRKERGS